MMMMMMMMMDDASAAAAASEVKGGRPCLLPRGLALQESVRQDSLAAAARRVSHIVVAGRAAPCCGVGEVERGAIASCGTAERRPRCRRGGLGSTGAR